MCFEDAASLNLTDLKVNFTNKKVALHSLSPSNVRNECCSGETPAYHYGTHYSSAMIVASYLVRMEPFTQIFLRLQVWCRLSYILMFCLLFTFYAC